MLMFGWTSDEYENTNALTVDWAFAIEATKHEVAEARRDTTM